MGAPATLRRLIEIESICHDCAQRVGQTIRNLRTAMSDGYPTSTPGSGSPGGGKGAGGRSINVPVTYGRENPVTINDRIPITSVEALALNPHMDPPAVDLDRLRTAAVIAANTLSDMLWEATGQNPVRPPRTASTLAHVTQAYRCAIVARHAAPNGHQPSTAILDDSAKAIEDVHRIIRAWGHTPGEPTRLPRELWPVDLTGELCVSCLRVGHRAPRSRTDRCDWCYKFELAEGFPVPIEIVEARHIDHKTITEDMVKVFRQRHRDQQAKRPSRRNRNAGPRPGASATVAVQLDKSPGVSAIPCPFCADGVECPACQGRRHLIPSDDAYEAAHRRLAG